MKSLVWQNPGPTQVVSNFFGSSGTRTVPAAPAGIDCGVNLTVIYTSAVPRKMSPQVSWFWVFCQPWLCWEWRSDGFSCWPSFRFLCWRDWRCAGQGVLIPPHGAVFPGTLTQNEMVFKRLHLGTVAYGLDSMDEVQSHIFSIYTQVQPAASPGSLCPKFHITGPVGNSCGRDLLMSCFWESLKVTGCLIHKKCRDCSLCSVGCFTSSASVSCCWGLSLK